ncbi:MAG: phytanoyl-CoA dioxygenase family protein [Phycisphaeraceae bacterium]|nr:phytanoyl-CoA dioxygenase family protein [Phycisphaeraceae bacterium]
MQLNEQQIRQFDDDGYLFVENLFDAEEVELLEKITETSETIAKGTIDHQDSQGTASRIWLTHDLDDDDIFSMASCCERVVRPTAQLLRGPVYHFHHKMMLKEPNVGGAWEWHQDYGYWYEEDGGLLFPEAASCMVAVNRATRANGCLQVLRGSNRLGRLDHGTVGAQVGADPERIVIAKKHLETVYCEMAPGTGLFFHCNTLHRSDQNHSPDRRWAFISCYATQRNISFAEEQSRLQREAFSIRPDEEVKRAGRAQLAAMQSALP